MVFSARGAAAHWLLFLVKICMASQPTCSPRSKAVSTPPPMDMCAPSRIFVLPPLAGSHSLPRQPPGQQRPGDQGQPRAEEKGRARPKSLPAADPLPQQPGDEAGREGGQPD